MHAAVKPQAPAKKYQLLVYGIETQGLKYSKSEIDTPKSKLVFGTLREAPRFQEFDGVILFQGTFESFEWVPREFRHGSWLRQSWDRDELDKRTKELESLLDADGFVCVLLHEAFIDHDGGRDFRGCDLSKRLAHRCQLLRDDFRNRVTGIRCHLNEFARFFEIYAAASTRLEPKYGDRLSKVIASAERAPVAVVHSGKVFFIPALLPKSTDEALKEFFTTLADALVSAWEKLREELPPWADDFRFAEEVSALARKGELAQGLERVESQLERFRKFKKVLALQGESLVNAVQDTLEQGLGLRTVREEAFREDLSLVDEQGNRIALVEVKGTNKGVQREHVNQADSHRERAGCPPEFPSILIVNTNLKSAASLSDKDQPVAMEQVEHAARNNVLILRAVDLLHLVAMVSSGRMSKEQVLHLLTESRGWCRVGSESCELLEGSMRS